MQSRYEETHSDLLEMEQVKQRLLLEMQRTPNSDEASNVSLVSLRTQIEHLDAVIAITRHSIARQLASWRLSNLFQRSYHRGRSNTPDQALEAENVILNQQIARIRQMGLLAEFQNSFGLQLFEWKKQSQRLGLGRDQ
jgi:hypothetical protein